MTTGKESNLTARLDEDPYLAPYRDRIRARAERTRQTERRLTGGECSLDDFAAGHEFFGMHRDGDGWVFREWAPNAEEIYLLGDFSGWAERDHFALFRREHPPGTWEIRVSGETLSHGDLYRLKVCWPGGRGDRIPSHARRVVQDAETKIYNAQVWSPPETYEWRYPRPALEEPLMIYEAHVGLATEEAALGTYAAFRREMLPRIERAGYNVVQLMAVMEHPYYGSFGYHVSNFFAVSSRFGTPEEFMALVDDAHGRGLAVTIDLVHSHSVSNEVEGLARFDGTRCQYFHEGERGYHEVWDSLCFDYAKPAVLHFLLSNCRFWLDAYNLDGFRFDGITSMSYRHHGLGVAFTSYDDYFNETVDEDALVYLALANALIHRVNPGAITIAEDVSGMPGIAAPLAEDGIGFDYRLAMGIPDCWFDLLENVRDEDWNIDHLWRELLNRRADERTVSYVESHDQAIVGGMTFIFKCGDAEMYERMRTGDTGPVIDRAVALHKIARLLTAATASGGYMTFIGNEFGHPEWVDFPREGNNWSHHYARRQWRLRDNEALKYHGLAEFDRVMVAVIRSSGMFAFHPEPVRIHNDDKVIAFVRGNMLVAVNLHPENSYTDYRIPVPAGKYILLFDSDEERFAGHGRIAPGQEFFTAPEGGDALTAYLPSRSAMVLRRED